MTPFTKFYRAVAEAEAAATRLALAREEFQAALECGFFHPDAVMLSGELEQLSCDIVTATNMLAKATSAVDRATFMTPRVASGPILDDRDDDGDIPF
jgi:hypothetical protein